MKKLALLGMAVTVLTLSACGGSQSVPHDIVIGGNPQNYLNTPTYYQGTEELAAFNAINAFRKSMGLGYWQQNVYLDQAAKNHMAYSIYNDPTFMVDIETSGLQGFTGTTPSNRAIYTGYYVLENTISATNVPTAVVGELYSTGSGANIVNDMVNTIYHRGAIMAQSTTQMGLARDTVGAISPTATTPTHWWINHGRLNSGQSVASNYVGLYPLNGQTGIPLSMTPEYPSVYAKTPGTGFDFATQTSSPVSVTTATLVDLNVSTFTVTQAGSTVPLSGTTWTMNNDPNLNTADYSSATINLSTPPTPVPTIPANEVFWVGNAPFLPNTTYTVNFTGTTYLIPYGVTNPITLTWSFTTGS